MAPMPILRLIGFAEEAQRIQTSARLKLDQDFLALFGKPQGEERRSLSPAPFAADIEQVLHQAEYQNRQKLSATLDAAMEHKP